MDEHFDPNDYADISQLLGDAAPSVETPAVGHESGAAPSVETPAVASPAVADARTLTQLLADIERRLLAIEALARRNGWPL